MSDNQPLSSISNDNIAHSSGGAVSGSGPLYPDPTHTKPTVYPNPPPPPPRFPIAQLLPILVITFILLGGLRAGVYLSSQNQNLSKQASEPKPTNTPGNFAGHLCQSNSECLPPYTCSPDICPSGTVNAGKNVCFNTNFVEACNSSYPTN